MNEDNVAIRLKGFIEQSGLTYSQFADKCGIPRPSLSQIISGRNKKISDVIVGQIHQAFPELSVLWLLFGEGSMIAKSESCNETNDDMSEITNENSKNTPVSTDASEYSILTGLETPVKPAQPRVINQVRTDERMAAIEAEIEKLRKNPRKVVQITVYYDDSTFETFYPAKEKRN